MVAKQVLRLQVPVQIVVLVHVGQTLQGLKHDVPDHLLRKKLLSLAHELVDVEVEVLEDEVEGVLLQTDFVKADNIRVRQLQQRLDLLLVDALVPPVVLFLHLFYRHDFT